MITRMTTSTTMNSSHTEIAAAWIVALALVAALVVHVLLPVTPPRLGHGVSDAETARLRTTLSGGVATPDGDLPLIESGNRGSGATADDDDSDE